MENASIIELWEQLRDGDSDSDMYYKLRQILQIVKEAGRKGRLNDVISPTAWSQIHSILQRKYEPHLHLMVIGILAVLATSSCQQKEIVNKGILKVLIQHYDRRNINLDPQTNDGKLQILLFEHLSSLLSLFSTFDKDTLLRNGLIQEAIIPKLINFLCPFSPLYCYSGDAKACVKTLTLRKSLEGNAAQAVSDKSKMVFGGVRDRYLRADETVLKSLKVNDQYYEVDLYDTSSGSKRQISHELIKRGHVLENGNGNESASSVTLEDSKRVDIIVTAVVNAEYFWANVGSEAVEKTELVTELIASLPEAERIYLTRPPISGSFVCGCHELRGCYRAQVIDADLVNARVFALDYGVVFRISWSELFLTMPDMRLGKVQPQARLCRLQGIQPKPVSDDIVEYCLTILCNLASHQDTVSQQYLAKLFTPGGNSNNLAYLVRLASHLPDTTAQRKTFRLLCNLCIGANDILKLTLADLDIIPIALGTIARATPGVQNPANQSLIKAAAALLGNLICNCQANKDVLTDERGLAILLPLAGDKIPALVRSAVLRTLVLFVGRGKTHVLVKSSQQQHSRSDARQQTGDARRQTTEGVLKQFDFRAPRNDRRSNSPSRCGAGENSTNRSGRNGSTTRQSETGSYFRRGTFDSDDEGERPNKGEGTQSGIDAKQSKSSASVQLVNTADVYNEQNGNSQCYVHDSKVTFIADAQHDIRTNKTMTTVSAVNLVAIICSFLNGDGGTIYLGINENGFVRGLNIDRDQRDEFRIGFGKVMKNYIQPFVRGSQFKIKCIPVVRRAAHAYHANNDLRNAEATLFVVEIVIKDHRSSTVYTAKHDCIAYIRKDAKSVEATYQEIRTLAVERREKVCELEMRGISEDIKHLQRVVDRDSTSSS